MGSIRFAVLSLFFFLACGKNQFASLETPKTEEAATKLLEQKRSNDAIDVILSDLGSEYGNLFQGVNSSTDFNQLAIDMRAKTDQLNAERGSKEIGNLLSILASAQAQLSGIDPLTIILEMATQESEDSTSGKNDLTKLFPVLPEPTSTNIRGLTLAITVMNGISSLTQVDNFKLGIFLVSQTALVVKSLDQDGDGQITPLEAIDLSDSSADSLLSTIDSAIATIGASDQAGGDARSAATAENINKLKQKILQNDGASDAERLRSFIAAH